VDLSGGLDRDGAPSGIAWPWGEESRLGPVVRMETQALAAEHQATFATH